MAQELLPTPIPFEDFARRVRSVFDDVARRGRPVLVERDGVVYRLEPQLRPPAVQTVDPADIWKNYDPEKVRAAMHQAAGALAGANREELLRDLYEQREQDTPGRPVD